MNTHFIEWLLIIPLHSHDNKMSSNIPPFISSFVRTSDLDMIYSAYTTVTDNNAWHIFDIPISEDTGYMFCKNNEIVDMMKKIDDDYKNCHSGASLGFTMRVLQEMKRRNNIEETK